MTFTSMQSLLGRSWAGGGGITKKLQVNELLAVGTLEAQVQRMKYNTGMG